MVDMGHYAGPVASGLYPDPLPHAHVVTSTTHKTPREPHGGLILTNDEALAKKIRSAVFPGNKGAKAVAFGEVLRPQFETYPTRVLGNAKISERDASCGRT